MAVDIIWSGDLDLSEVHKKVKLLEKEYGTLEQKGNDAFENTGKGAGSSALAVGGIAGVVTALTTKFIELGEAAARALIGIVTQSVELAKTQRLAEGGLDAVLSSTGNAAGLAAVELKTLAGELQNVTNFGDETIIGAENLLLTFTNIGRDVFPQATKTILDMSTALNQGLKESSIQLGKALNDPIKGISALSEVGVSFTEQQKEQVSAMVEAGDIAGAQALILAELNREFGGAAAAAREADGNMIAFGNAIGDLQEQAGNPILDALGEQLGKILDFIAKNQDELNLLAAAFGDVIAAVIDLVGSGINDYLDSTDPSALFKVADALGDLVQIGGTFLSIAYEWISAILAFTDAVDPTNDAIHEATGQAGGLTEILIFLLDILAKSAAGWRGLIAVIEPTTTAISATARAMADLATGDFEGAADNIGKAFESISSGFFDVEAAQKATNASYDASKKKLDDLRVALQSNNDTMQTRRDSLNQDTSAEIANAKAKGEAAQAALAAAAAAEAQAKAEEELNKALEKVGEALAKVELDTARARADALTKSNQDRTKIELDFSRNREKDERDLQRKLKDIEADATDERTKKAAEIEKQASQKRVDIQTQFRRQLEDINRRYDQSGLEAEQNRDAIAFLQNEKQRQRDIEAAGTQRDRSTQDVNVETSRSQAELQALDDALQQKLEKERENFRIRQEEAGIAQQQRLTDLDTNLQLENEKISLAEQRKLEDLQTKSKEELQIIQDATGQQINLVTNSEQLKTLIVEQESAKRIKALEAERAAAVELAAATVPAAPTRPTNATVAGRRALAASGPQFSFAEGGIVPGPIGASVPVIAHPGEGFLNRGQMSNLFKVLSNPASPLPVSPSASNTSITNNRQQQIEQLNFGASLDLIERVTSMEQAIEMLTRVRR